MDWKELLEMNVRNAKEAMPELRDKHLRWCDSKEANMLARSSEGYQPVTPNDKAKKSCTVAADGKIKVNELILCWCPQDLYLQREQAREAKKKAHARAKVQEMANAAAKNGLYQTS